MKCKKCGKEVGKTDAFCQYCGTKIEQEEKKVAASTTKKEEAKVVKVEKVEEKKAVMV